jgi:1-phosphatidylinositol-3-phosphate 5-kinase
MYTDPICVSNEAKALLGMTVWNDTLCLASLNVMDYSLVVGVDEEKNQLVIGIIDYMRTYTWDKQLETWVKQTMGQTKKPTIISPKLYKKRFRNAIWNYFILLPSVSTSLQSGYAIGN